MNLTANWMTRGPVEVRVIVPAFGAEATGYGFAKFTLLNSLKNSVRISNFCFSVTGMNFTAEKSTLACAGPKLFDEKIGEKLQVDGCEGQWRIDPTPRDGLVFGPGIAARQPLQQARHVTDTVGEMAVSLRSRGKSQKERYRAARHAAWGDPWE